MIQISIVRDASCTQIIISGHARYANPGYDIVCAAVSTLTCTLANVVQAWSDEDLIWEAIVQITDKIMHISIQPSADPYVASVLDAFIDSYSQLAEQYPANVNVRFLHTPD